MSVLQATNPLLYLTKDVFTNEKKQRKHDTFRLHATLIYTNNTSRQHVPCAFHPRRVSQIPKAAFIPVHGVPTKASKLFDPRVEVLSEIFGDEPDAFPTGEFAEEEWLNVLVDVGLRNKLDVDTILQCAKKVCAGGGGAGGG